MSICNQGAAIEIRDLKKEYCRGEGVHGLNLVVPRGSSFGLLGPNGAGKSTTIKLLMGLIRPSSGDAEVLGHSIINESESIRSLVGYVPERHYIYPWMTIGEVVWFTRAFYSSWDQQLCDELLLHYELHPAKKVKQLSHGMTTKLALVLALAHDPDLLLLDEPTTGLDPLIREEFLDGIRHLLQRRSRTVLLSSHILSDIEKVADTIGIINEGKLLICAPRTELMEKVRRISVTLEAGSRDPVPLHGTVWQELSNGRWNLTVYGFSTDTVQQIRQQNKVETVNVTEMSLEEIFKDFIKGSRQR